MQNHEIVHLRIAACIAGLMPAPALAQTSLEDLVYHQQPTSSDYGGSIASGDVNGDGILDLAVADPAWKLKGRGWVLLGPDFEFEIPVTIPNQAEYDFMGSTLHGAWKLADMNGDQLDDLLMSSGNSSAGTSQTLVGRALVCFAPDFVQVIELTHPMPGQQIGFGASMVPYDFTGDGVVDVAVGASRAPGVLGNPYVGRIDIYSGTALSSGSVQTLVPPEPQFGERWGDVLLVADYDHDGVDDLLVNNRPEGIIGPGFSWLKSMDPTDSYGWQMQGDYYVVNETLVDIDLDGSLDYLGATLIDASKVPLTYGPDYLETHFFYTPPGTGTTNFGHGLDVGDVDRDGYPDVVIGMPGLDGQDGGVDYGRVTIHYGPDFEITQSFDGLHPTAELGVGVHVVDLDGNGFAEVFAGAGAELGGRLHLYLHHTLRIVSPDQVSLSTGGVVRYSIEVGALSGDQLYLTALGASGSVPGLELPLPTGSVHVPLNPDALTFAALGQLGSPTYEDFLGVTNASGVGGPTLHVPPLTNPALVGTVITAVAVVFDGTGNVDYATEAAEFTLIP